MTIADLKTGAKLVFGNYGVGAGIHHISWLKTGRENMFLSEFVLDILKFDNHERSNPQRDFYYHGNGDYETSNIIQFMNSHEEDWYESMHRYDAPPGSPDSMYDSLGDYFHHPGFLHEFEDYELECLDGRIDLPTVANIIGTGREARFPLFNRKGYRGRPTIDLVYNKGGHDMNKDSFCEFWVSDASGFYVGYIDRAGARRDTYANSRQGLRPICRLKPTTEVELQADGTYRVVPFTASKPRSSKICTDEEFLELMGLL